jgi:membrane-associated protein
MDDVWEFLKNLTDPKSILDYGGVALLLFVIFAETGLLIGFFLPGDSLVFISGMMCSSEPFLLNIHVTALLPLLMLAAIIGNVVGYAFGRKVGPSLFRRKDSWIFKKKYLEVTESFYNRHGAKTLILGRFLPYIRTFAPILAGVIKVPFGFFMLYNVIGAVAWIGSLGTAGYYLGRFEFVRENVEYIVIFLIIVTLIPVARTYLRERKFQRENRDKA